MNREHGDITMKPNIFDTTNMNDLPKNLRMVRQDKFADEIMEIFNIAAENGLTELNVNQVMVAHYRKFHPDDKDAKTNIQIMNKLFAMAKSGKYPLEKVASRNGTYRLKK